MKKRNYPKTERDVVVVIVTPVVIDAGKTTVIAVTTDQAVIVLKVYARSSLEAHCSSNALAAVFYFRVKRENEFA